MLEIVIGGCVILKNVLLQDTNKHKIMNNTEMDIVVIEVPWKEKNNSSLGNINN